MSKSDTNIAAAAERIAADAPEGFDPFRLVNIAEITTEADAERIAVAVAVASEAATSRHTERTITAKTNIGLAIFAAAKIRCAADESGKTTMPELKNATVGKLGKILGLSDSPGKNADGADLPSAVDRFGYKVGTLGACVDLARGIIGDVDKLARQDIRDSGESISERPLRAAILARINPDATRNRQAGAESMAAAKLAAAAGRKAGTVKVKTADGSEKLVKIDAEKLTAVRNKIAASALSDAQIAALSDDAIAATILALTMVRDARAAGVAKAPAKPKAPAKA